MANIAIVATGNTCLLFFSLKTLYEGSFVESVGFPTQDYLGRAV